MVELGKISQVDLFLNKGESELQGKSETMLQKEAGTKTKPIMSSRRMDLAMKKTARFQFLRIWKEDTENETKLH